MMVAEKDRVEQNFGVSKEALVRGLASYIDSNTNVQSEIPSWENHVAEVLTGRDLFSLYSFKEDRCYGASILAFVRRSISELEEELKLGTSGRRYKEINEAIYDLRRNNFLEEISYSI